MEKHELIINTKINTTDFNRLDIEITDNYDNRYEIEQGSILHKRLNRLLESKYNNPITNTEISILNNQIKDLCTRCNVGLIQLTKTQEFIDYEKHLQAEKSKEISYEVQEAIRVIESFKNTFGFPKYNRSERKYILNKITNAVREVNDPCMDNFRFSDGSYQSMKQYMIAKEHECCGFWDEEIKLKSGKIFLFGFNYGH